MTKHFITGAAQSVTNSVERLTALRKAHPEWEETRTAKAIARERVAEADKPVNCSQGLTTGPRLMQCMGTSSSVAPTLRL
jgi:hypothetical protein